jgi:hypothetical protein
VKASQETATVLMNSCRANNARALRLLETSAASFKTVRHVCRRTCSH